MYFPSLESSWFIPFVLTFVLWLKFASRNARAVAAGIPAGIPGNWLFCQEFQISLWENYQNWEK